MRQHLSKYLALALLMAGGSLATASATVYNWTLSGGGNNGSGSLVTGAADGGGYDVLSFTGTVDGAPVTLAGGQPGPVGSFTPDRSVYFNNILYTALDAGSSDCAGSATLVDGCGIAFNLDNGYGNIFANYSGKGTGAYQFDFTYGGDTYHDYDATFALTPDVTPPPSTLTPEPASLLFLATGLASLGLPKLRRRMAHASPLTTSQENPR